MLVIPSLQPPLESPGLSHLSLAEIGKFDLQTWEHVKAPHRKLNTPTKPIELAWL